MNRKVIAATFVLSPLFLHAQSPPAAQPANKHLSKLVQPCDLHAFTTSERTSTTTTPARTSTGVVEPKLIHTSDIYWYGDPNDAGRTAVIQLNVDANGKPTNLKVVRSISPVMDQRVLQGVQRYRFKPGMLDDQPITVPVTLELTVLNPAVQ